MGEALVGGLIARGHDPGFVTVVEPDSQRRQVLAETLAGVSITEQPVPATNALIAVKPHHAEGVCAETGGLGVERVLPIPAGVPIATPEAALAGGVAVVRAMPNTPSLVGHGASAVAGGARASQEDLDWAESLLGAVGLVVRTDEDQLDAVTGLS